MYKSVLTVDHAEGRVNKIHRMCLKMQGSWLCWLCTREKKTTVKKFFPSVVSKSSYFIHIYSVGVLLRTQLEAAAIHPTLIPSHLSYVPASGTFH